MPRNGSGVYSKPAGTTAVPNTTIESSKFNSVVDDLVADANAARPSTAGGTGATSVSAARQALTTYSTKSTGYTAVALDAGAIHRCTAALTVALTAASTLAAGWTLTILADGGAVTIDPNGAETINGLTTMIVPDGATAEIICDGTAFFTVLRPSGWQTIETRTFSGVSAIDFTNLGAFSTLWLTGFIALSASGVLGWRTSSNNGASYDSGGSDYSFQGATAKDTVFGASRTAAASYGLLGGGGTSEFLEATFCNFNVSGQSCVSLAAGTAFDGNATTIFVRQDGAIRASTTARNALRIFPTTAITLSGTLTLRGAV